MTLVPGQIDSFIRAHLYAVLAGYWLFSNMVLQMPPPAEPNGNPFYKWFFGVLHAISGAVPRVASNFLPAGSWVTKLLAGGNGASNGAPEPPKP